MPVWKRLHDPSPGYLFQLSEALSMLDWRRPGLLVPTADHPMMIFSDYSGQHKHATHEAYSFLVTDRAGMIHWERLNRSFRQRWLPDGRELSFKRLNEPVRRRSLPPFLEMASEIGGNVITFLVSRTVGSFVEGGAITAKEAFPDCFSESMSAGTVEKMLRIASFVALLVAGLRSERQPCLWLSDADEALETFDRREQLARLSTYITYGVTRWAKPADIRFGTTGDAEVPVWCKDAAALTDIVAGAYCQLVNLLPTFRGSQHRLAIVPATTARDARARVVGDWMASSPGPLRHVLLRLERDSEGEVRCSAQSFAFAVP